MNIENITYEELAEIGDFFGYRWDREGYLHYYDTTREQVPPNPLDSYADLDKMWDIIQGITQKWYTFWRRTPLSMGSNIHGFDYTGEVICQ